MYNAAQQFNPVAAFWSSTYSAVKMDIDKILAEVDEQIFYFFNANFFDNDHNNNEEFIKNRELDIQKWQEEDKEWLQMSEMTTLGIYIYYESFIRKEPCWNSSRTGYMLIMEILNGHEARCFQDFRLDKNTFLELCGDLRNHYGLKSTHDIIVEEQVGMFLMTLAHGAGNRLIQETFQHSGDTISRHFHMVLNAVLRLSTDIIKPDVNYNSGAQYHVPQNERYLPYFKNCIGAIDGTHIKARLPKGQEIPYIGRKGIPTQNIMAVCDFNMCFTFVWPRWEGSAHDTRIFTQALNREELKFSHPTEDKYYVVDAGYPNTKGYMAPYTGQFIRYHLPDFNRGITRQTRAPRGVKEKFNYLHSSLRNVIERTFGVWKARWAILRDMPFFSFETQRNIVIASMAIHNYIRKKSTSDNAFQVAEKEGYRPDDAIAGGDENVVHWDGASSLNNGLIMQAVRDNIALQISNLD